jgi:hypothetical protein
MLDVGGLWVVPQDADPVEVVTDVRNQGLRALEIHRRDLGFLRELPDLAYLHLGDVYDTRPLHDLERLVGLSVSSWEGTIDFRAFPELESFHVTECARKPEGLETLLAGHPKLRHLGIGRYRYPDLAPLANLRLERLYLGDSRHLRSLAGAERLAPTLEALDLFISPYLESLDGIEALDGLQALELASLRHVTTLEFASRLPRLRFLSVFDLKNVESLWPLADHPTLEFLAFGRVRDLDLDPLTRIPNLRLVLTGRYRWNRDVHSFPYLHDVPWDHPDRIAWQGARP